jgi:hypothetical protein
MIKLINNWVSNVAYVIDDLGWVNSVSPDGKLTKLNIYRPQLFAARDGVIRYKSSIHIYDERGKVIQSDPYINGIEALYKGGYKFETYRGKSQQNTKGANSGKTRYCHNMSNLNISAEYMVDAENFSVRKIDSDGLLVAASDMFSFEQVKNKYVGCTNTHLWVMNIKDDKLTIDKYSIHVGDIDVVRLFKTELIEIPQTVKFGGNHVILGYPDRAIVQYDNSQITIPNATIPDTEVPMITTTKQQLMTLILCLKHKKINPYLINLIIGL